MKAKLLFPICLLLIAIACIGFASAADTNNNTLSLEEPQAIGVIDTSNAIDDAGVNDVVDTGVNDVVDTGLNEVQNSTGQTTPVKEVNNTDIAPDAIVSDNTTNISSNNTTNISSNNTTNISSNNTAKGPKNKPTLDIKGPKNAEKIKKQDDEITKYYLWATKNNINPGHVILEIFKTHSLDDTADIAAKVLSRIYYHGTPTCASDIKDMMRLMYMGNGRYEDKYGDTPANYGSEIRLIMFQKNPTFDPFIVLHMFIFGVR